MFIHLLLTANYQKKEWKGIAIDRGQRIVSVRGLSKETGLSVKEIRGALDKLVATGEIERNPSSQYTIISINNYDDFQGNDGEKVSEITQKKGTRRAQQGHTFRHNLGQTKGTLEASPSIEIKNVNTTKIHNLECNLKSTGQTKDTSEGKPSFNCKTKKGQQLKKEEIKKEDSKDILSGSYKIIIDYLNEKTGKNFKHTTKANRTHMHARFADGFTVEDFKRVIDRKAKEWKNDPKMQQYLRPETLFGTKFESYLNQEVKSESRDYDAWFAGTTVV